MGTLDDGERALLDRESVLREIDALVREPSVRGGRTIVRVVGPPGIGKTAVLRTIVRTFDGRARFVAAESAGRTDPGAVARLLTDAGSIEPRSLPSLTARLRALVAQNDLIALDDVQWIDEHSLRELLVAIRAPASLAILLGDRRQYASEWPAHETISLAPLRRSPTIELVRRIYPDVTPPVAEEIAEAAAGVPFAVTLLALDAASRDVMDVGVAALSVAAVVARRLARLTSRARNIADLASLAEPPISLRVLSRASGIALDEIGAVVSELADLVTVAGPDVAFRHDALATAVAAMVENPAAAYAQLLSGYEEESTSLAAIVRCALGYGQHERAASAALELARVLARDGSLGSALRYAEIAMKNALRPIPVEYAVEYAVILQLLSRDEDAAAFLRQSIRAAIGAGDARAAAELAASFLNPAVALERFAEIEGLCDRIAALTDSQDVLERLSGVRLASLAYAGRIDDYRRRSAMTTQRGWIDSRTAAFVAALCGDANRAANEVAAYASGLGLQHARQQTADRIFEAMLAFYFRGTSALDALDVLPTEDTRYPSERALRVLRRVCAGRWSDARQLLFLDATSGDEPEPILEVRMFLSGLSRDRAADSRSAQTLRSMIGQRRVRHAASSARWYLVAKGADCPPDIEAFVRDTLDVAPMPYAFAGSPLSTAQLRDRFGEARCRAAIEQYPVFDTPWHRAHHELALGLVDSSNERLRAARAAFEALNCPALATIAGIALPVPRARDLAAARTLGLAPAEPPATAALTARERAVAERTARGASNQEVAEALSISVRTVETHLTKIYAKLGVGSRGAMTALMHELYL